MPLNIHGKLATKNKKLNFTIESKQSNFNEMPTDFVNFTMIIDSINVVNGEIYAQKSSSGKPGIADLVATRYTKDGQERKFDCRCRLDLTEKKGFASFQNSELDWIEQGVYEVEIDQVDWV
jgi:hypothetical protein